MKKTTFTIDLFKEFKLPVPVCGLVNKITEPKGLRKEETYGFSYRFKTELMPHIYDKKPMELEPGIYQVLDIAKLQGLITWNHYLFIIDSDGAVYPVAEYVDYPETDWVKKSLQIVKDYFNGKPVEPIATKQFKVPKQKGWGRR